MATIEKEKAIDVVKQMVADGQVSQEVAEKYFPELKESKESEEERIRKALLEMVHDTTGDELWVDYNVHKEEALAWLEKQVEQKPAIEMKTPEESLGIDSDTYNKIVDECIYGEQKPADWSENDEEQLGRALYMMEQLDMTKSWDDVYNWLKSIRPQNRWKPSEEQMITLRHVISGCSYDIDPLVELETKLKEL